MAKRAYIIHMWDGNSVSCWIPWLKEELQKKGIDAIAPDMPDTNAPNIEKWVDCISETVENPDSETCFVGHSIGCQSITRYLSSLPEGITVKGAVFVAPWVNLVNLTAEESEVARPWTETPIDWQRAKLHAQKFTVIYSGNDKWVTEEEAKSFANKLDAKIVLDSDRGHFTDDDDVTQLPSVLEETLGLFEQ